MTREEVEHALRGMIQDIESARVDLSQGKTGQLENIGERITEVCAQATALADEDAVAVRPLMEELREDLQRFSGELEEIERRLNEDDEQS